MSVVRLNKNSLSFFRSLKDVIRFVTATQQNVMNVWEVCHSVARLHMRAHTPEDQMWARENYQKKPGLVK